jgi:hypothetical protein
MPTRQRNKRWYWLAWAAAGLLVLLGGVAWAQGQPQNGPPNPRQPVVGSGFTFQGQLVDDGSPVNGDCDLRVGLWAAASGGSQIGSSQTVANAPVNQGRFTVTLNGGGEFGPTAFTGQARRGSRLHERTSRRARRKLCRSPVGRRRDAGRGGLAAAARNTE